MKNLFVSERNKLDNYRDRTPSYYLAQIDPEILASFTSEQLDVITHILDRAIPQTSPKIVDFRINVDLIFSRFYVVLFVGKDRRKKQRRYVNEGVARVGNAIAAVILLIGANLVISAFILLFAYLFKSAIGLDFFPGHISETVNKL